MKTFAFYLLRMIVPFCLCVSLSGCLIKPYHFDLTQGNTVTAEQIAQVERGMSEEQVQYVLGTPMLRDVFHTQRWDYVYYDKPNKGKEKRYHVAIFFDDGKVSQVTHDPLPSVA